MTDKKNKRLDIKIGYQCNNHCLFCVQGDKRKEILFRDKEDIKKDILQARNLCDSIVFTGGEPTLHPYILDLVSFAKHKNFFSIQIQSNGRMFAYNSFCQDIINAGASQFSPALHGQNAKIHDYLTAIKGSFLQTLKGIKNLKKLKQYVITNTVITKYNYKYLPKLAELFVSLGVNQFQFAFVHITGSAWKNRKDIVPKKSDISIYVKKALDIGIKANMRVMTEAIPYCLLEGYENCLAEKFMPEAMIIEGKFKVEDYTHYRKNQGKAKSERCKKCIYYLNCEGPWKEYPDMFGWDEFKPILK